MKRKINYEIGYFKHLGIWHLFSPKIIIESPVNERWGLTFEVSFWNITAYISFYTYEGR